ncbi:MAG: hypothetical protein AAF988_06220 [Pseudomonadota bacterium]
MSKKPVITRILLDPEGSPFLKNEGVEYTVSSGVFRTGQKLDQDFNFNIMFFDHPHECPLEPPQQPKIKISGEENFILFMRKIDDKIEFKLFAETDDPSSNESKPVFEASMPSARILEIAADHFHDEKDKLLDIFRKNGSKMTSRFKGAMRKSTKDGEEKKCKALMKVLYPVLEENKRFLGILSDAIEGITMKENIHLFDTPGVTRDVSFGPRTKYTN